MWSSGDGADMVHRPQDKHADDTARSCRSSAPCVCNSITETVCEADERSPRK